jgi:hypothetical protein
MKRKKMSKRWIAKKNGFRSGLEMEISHQLTSNAVNFDYESIKVPYTIPARNAKYTPDFILHNGIIIETKGRFVAADRKKQLLVKEQNPHLDIRFVFSDSSNRISKKSKTTYADWCTQHGFQYADKVIPSSWLH